MPHRILDPSNEALLCGYRLFLFTVDPLYFYLLHRDDLTHAHFVLMTVIICKLYAMILQAFVLSLTPLMYIVYDRLHVLQIMCTSIRYVGTSTST
jgi:hypothetical protein